MKLVESHPIVIEAWGPQACFSMPQMPTERMTYPIMTPSAARGLLQSIYWHPQFQFEIQEIEMLSPIKYQTVQKLELTEIPTKIKPIPDRCPRTTQLLMNVHYRITATIVTFSEHERNKSRDIFLRRVEKGQRYHVPRFGIKEMTAFISNPTGKQPVDLTLDLGYMLFDMTFMAQEVEPIFFHAELDHGIMRIPQELYRERRHLYDFQRFSEGH